jgi:hypothetical protein
MEESGFAITSINGRINRAVWGPLNRTIVTDREDATIRIWDLEVRITWCYVPTNSFDGRYNLVI